MHGLSVAVSNRKEDDQLDVKTQVKFGSHSVKVPQLAPAPNDTFFSVFRLHSAHNDVLRDRLPQHGERFLQPDARQRPHSATFYLLSAVPRAVFEEAGRGEKRRFDDADHQAVEAKIAGGQKQHYSQLCGSEEVSGG